MAALLRPLTPSHVVLLLGSAAMVWHFAKADQALDLCKKANKDDNWLPPKEDPCTSFAVKSFCRKPTAQTETVQLEGSSNTKFDVKYELWCDLPKPVIVFCNNPVGFPVSVVSGASNSFTRAGCHLQFQKGPKGAWRCLDCREDGSAKITDRKCTDSELHNCA